MTEFSKKWCQGFCDTCGTGCCHQCEEIHEKTARIAELESALKEISKHHRYIQFVFDSYTEVQKDKIAFRKLAGPMSKIKDAVDKWGIK